MKFKLYAGNLIEGGSVQLMSPLVYSCCLFIGESIGYYTLVPKEIHIPEREEQSVNILFYQGSVLKNPTGHQFFHFSSSVISWGIRKMIHHFFFFKW